MLRTCYIDSQPVCIQLPTDMVAESIGAEPLKTPIDVSPHPSNTEAEKLALQIVLDKLYAAKRPAFLIDGALESSDLIITIGTIQSDLNTTGFTYQISKLNTIDIEYDCVQVGYAKFDKVYFKSFVPPMEQQLDPARLAQTAYSIPKISLHTPVDTESQLITHAYLWPRVSKFLKLGDFVICDAGTSFVSVWDAVLPRNVQVINQILWSSIGYGVGAAQGASLAARELGKGQRIIVFEGDGSFQLTAQELSTIIHHDLDVTMFVIENDGYEIERWLHGWEASYNDIPQWQYSKLPEVLTTPDSPHKVRTWRIKTRSELEALLNDSTFAEGKGLQLVEMHMPRGDAPKTLRDFAARRQ